MLVPSKRKCLLIGVISEATGKIFLAERNISQGGVFPPLHVKLYFVLLLDHFILLRLKARQGRGEKGADTGCGGSVPSNVLGVLRVVTVRGI